MGRFRHLVLALIVGPVGVVALAPPAVLAQESKKDIIEELQGKWRRMSSEDNGKPAEKDEVAIRYSFQGKSLTVTRGKDFEQRGDWKIVEVGKKTFKVDYTITEGVNKGETVIGIAAIDGDLLKFCYCFASQGRGRPDEFAAKAGDGCSLLVFRRAKP
jgi:uncharacterized protein (TIGR03067 family)